MAWLSGDEGGIAPSHSYFYNMWLMYMPFGVPGAGCCLLLQGVSFGIKYEPELAVLSIRGLTSKYCNKHPRPGRLFSFARCLCLLAYCYCDDWKASATPASS